MPVARCSGSRWSRHAATVSLGIPNFSEPSEQSCGGTIGRAPRIYPRPAGADLCLRRGFGTAFAAIPPPYIAQGRVWASCTPIVLDRHLKATGNEQREEEIAGLIRQACANIGIPEPDRVVPGKHSAFEGTPSAYPSGSAPHWTRWRLPEALASRQLTHAVIAFREPVHGPVILGAGRFVGLGLCRPLRSRGVLQ